MHGLRAILLAVALLGLAAPAVGDQTDERLDALFDRLLKVPGPAEAAPIESQIWSIWYEHSDRAISLLMDKGLAAMSRRDLRKALEIFDQMVKIDPEFAEGWNKRATVHYMMDNFIESHEDIDRTLALEPRHFGALSGRGLVYAAQNEMELALQAFEEALGVNPQMVGPRLNAEAIRKGLKDREI